MSVRDDVASAMAAGKTRILVVGTMPGVEGLPERWRISVVPLDLSWRFRVPISLDVDALRARLSFDGVACDLVIPWGAVLAINPVPAAPEPARPSLRLVSADEADLRSANLAGWCPRCRAIAWVAHDKEEADRFAAAHDAAAHPEATEPRPTQPPGAA